MDFKFPKEIHVDRPLTQREIQKEKRSKAEEPKMMVTNMTKRSIPIQVRENGSDFYIGERSVMIGPGKSFTERMSLFNESQISNLRAKGEIRVLDVI